MMVFKRYGIFKSACWRGSAIRALLTVFLLYNIGLKAQQCTGCTTVITGGSSNFSVNVGQVVCIAPGVTYTGNITLNGGTLCNAGTLTQITFKKGTFNNYGIFSDPNSITINANGSLVINNYGGARFMVTNGMAVTASNMVDTVVFNNKTAGLFNTGTSLSSHDVVFRIYNGDNGGGGTGGGGVGTSAIFNVGAGFSVGDATEFRLRNFGTGYFNVAGNFAINATGNRSIANWGIINVNNAFNMSGIGNSAHVIDINNFSQWNVTGNISTGINNSQVNIKNKAGGIIYSGITITMSKATNNLINDGELYAGQDMIIQNGSAINNNFISVNRDMKVNTGIFTNNNGAYVLNGRNFIAQNQAAVSNRGTLQPFGNLQVNSQSSFVNLYEARAIPNVSAVVQGTSTVTNYGSFATPGPIRITSSTFTNALTGSFSSGSNVTIQTKANVINSGTFIAGQDLSLTNSNFTNGNFVNVIAEFVPTSTSNAVNDGTMTVGTNVRITTATVTNNQVISVSNNFSLTNGSAVFNSNSFLDVTNEFKNTGLVNSGEGSFLRTTSYSVVGTGTINGPGTSFVEPQSARVLISGQSNNSGYLNGKLVVYDQSLSSNASNVNYGFDAVSNGSRISSSVSFLSRAVAGGGPPVIVCNQMSSIYFVNVGSNLTSTCPGSFVPLNAQLQHTVATGGGGTIFVNLPTSNSNYTWQPGNFNYPNPQVSPNTTTTYTCYVTLPNGCVVSNTLLVTVNPSPAPTIVYNGTPWTYSSPSALTFPVTLSGPSGGVYTYSPSGLNIDPNTGLITANGSAYGTYTVYYTTPESGNCYSMYTCSTVVTLIDLDCHLSVLPDDAHLCEGDQIQLTASGGADGYTWTPSAGLSCTNCPAPILTFSNSTTQFTVTSTRGGTLCGTFVLRIFPRDDCQDNSIIGCCFSNYGAGVYINDKNTHINVYCNVVDEISNLMPGPTFERGEFESYGNLNFTKDWIHNGQNDLYVTNTGTTMTFGNIDQNIKGNSSTHFNKLTIDGNGLRTIWINEYAYSDLDLVSNEFVIQNYNFYMKNPAANVYRTSGFASTGVNGYFSRLMDAFNINPNKTYLFPLGTRASTLIPFRYRPVEMMNNRSTQGDEVSANFMNIAPSLATDFTFINANPNYTNVVTDMAPPITQVNNRYYHKLKNTVPPPLPPSDLVIRSYYPPIDGAYQSIAEWELNNLSTLDWWGQTPGSSANFSISTNAGTFGQMYAMSNGTVNFDEKPFCLAITSIYVNTSSFNNPNTVVTINPAPSNNTAVTTSSTTNVTNTGTLMTTNTTTTSTSGGVTTSTTTSTTGTLVTTTTSTVVIVGGNTTNTTVTTTGTNVTVVTSTTGPGIGGTTTNTTTTTTGTLVTTTTSTTSPTIGNVSSSTVTSTGGGTTTTTTSTVVNNGNTSTTTSSVVTVVGASTVVVTTTCVTVGSGNSAITTCSTQTQPNTNITITSNTITTVASNTTATNTSTNVFNPGPIALATNPVAGDYIIGISTNTLCDIPGKVKFTVTPGGTINPNAVLYSDGTGAPNFSVNLSEDLYTINNVTVSINLNSTPKDILAQCVNSVNVNTTSNNDFILSQSIATESIAINVPFAPATGLILGNFNVYDASNTAITPYVPVALNLGTNNIDISHTTLPVGVYHFEFNMSFTLPAGPVTETVKGQFIIK